MIYQYIMRYTTVIDISEYPSLYKNHNVRLVYLHMSLKCGYHDDDKDLLDMSIRQLAYSAGLTVSATRHALSLLQRAGLLEKVGALWSVKKWQPSISITPRANVRVSQKDIDAAQDRRKNEQHLDEERTKARREREKNLAQGKTSFMVWYEGMEKKAAEGDIEAQETVNRHRANYEAQVAIVKRLKDEKQ